jgi:hypothetical protein
MHMSGTGFSGGYASMVILLDEVDASTYRGIRFWTRSATGSFRLRVDVGTSASIDMMGGGTCVSVNGGLCRDHWGAYRDVSTTWQIQDVSFSQLSQEGWGVAVVKDLPHVRQLQFLFKPFTNPPNPSSFDLWLDDIELY